MMTDCMHTSFPLTRTAYGGIGVGIIHMAPVGDSVGDGVRHGTTIIGTIPVIGVAATGVAIGVYHYHHHHYYPHYFGHGWGWWLLGQVVMDGMAQADVTRGIHAGRYTNSYSSSRPSRNNYVNSYDRNSRNSYVGNSRQNVRNSANSYRTATRNGSSSGRVVSGSNSVNSVRPNRSAIRTRTGETLSPSQAAGVRPGNSYSRPTEGRGFFLYQTKQYSEQCGKMQQDLLIREQGLQVVALIVTIVAFRILVAVHTLVAVVLLVIVRLTLTVVVELLLPVVVFLVAVVLLAVPVAVFPVQVVAADRVPDKW